MVDVEALRGGGEDEDEEVRALPPTPDERGGRRRRAAAVAAEAVVQRHRGGGSKRALEDDEADGRGRDTGALPARTLSEDGARESSDADPADANALRPRRAFIPCHSGAQEATNEAPPLRQARALGDMEPVRKLKPSPPHAISIG